MLAQINADRGQRFQVKFLHICRWRLQDHLQLCVLIQSIGIFAIAPIRRTSRGLDVSDLVWNGPQDAKKRLRRHRSRSHFYIIRLLQNASPPRPKGLEAQNQLLKCERRGHELLGNQQASLYESAERRTSDSTPSLSLICVALSGAGSSPTLRAPCLRAGGGRWGARFTCPQVRERPSSTTFCWFSSHYCAGSKLAFSLLARISGGLGVAPAAR